MKPPSHHPDLTLGLTAVHAFRMRRQMLTPSTRGDGRAGHLTALRIVQPAPGGLRWLTARMHTPDQHLWEKLAEEGNTVKARFFRGTLGWVLRDDLALYLDACAEKFPPPLSKTAHSILATLAQEAPLITDLLQIKVRTSRASLREALVELGRNQLVVEGPQDIWRLTNSLVTRAGREESRCVCARGELISRFLADYGPASLRELADWSGWSLSTVKAAIDRLVETGTVVPCRLDSAPQTHFVRLADVQKIKRARPLEHCLSILACYDPVVRAQQTELKQRFGYGCSIPAFWHYLLVDGEWHGALRIHYKTKMLWIRDLMLEEPVLADSQLLREVFDTICRELTAGLSSIRIDWVNDAPADSPVNQTLLSSHGYTAQDGSYVSDLASG